MSAMSAEAALTPAEIRDSIMATAAAAAGKGDAVDMSLVDPELRPLLSNPFFHTDITADNFQQLRNIPLPPVDPKLVNTVELAVHTIEMGRERSVELYVYKPKHVEAESKKTLLPCAFHMHGGGYIAFNCAAQEASHRKLVDELGICVATVEYSLAPETKYPGQIDECFAALKWVLGRSSELGIDRNCIGVMGESAGGGLAACLALKVRDEERAGNLPGFSLAFQHLIFPMLDDRTSDREDLPKHQGEFVWRRASNKYGWTSILPTSTPPGSPNVPIYAAAARAEDLSHLPPAFIAVGDLDLFVDENVDYARRLMLNGVNTELHVYPGAFHGFHMATNASVTKQAISDSRNALARATKSCLTPKL